jgi:hypothetical protein
MAHRTTPAQPHRPPELDMQVFIGSDAVRRGLLTEAQLRSRAWRRIRKDVYADERVSPTHDLACRAALLRMPPGVVIAGPSAAYLLGVAFAAGFTDRVHLIAPPTVRVCALTGVRAHVTELGERDIVDGDMPYTTTARTAWDVAVWLPAPRAVTILDAMLRNRLVTRADLDAILLRRDGTWRAGRARVAFRMAGGDARTPADSALRARLMEDGLPRPVIGQTITIRTSGGTMSLDLDMSWSDHRVALEYKLDQLALLTANGWHAIYASPTRARRDFLTVAREVREALTRQGWRPTGEQLSERRF